MRSTVGQDSRSEAAVPAGTGPRFARREHLPELEARREELLDELRRLDDPGLVTRWLPGRRRRSVLDRALGRAGSDDAVGCERAWPVGCFTWWQPAPDGEPVYELLATGYTASGRFVPMQYPTGGDPVEAPYARRGLIDDRTRPDARAGVPAREPRVEHVVAALETALGLRRA